MTRSPCLEHNSQKNLAKNPRDNPHRIPRRIPGHILKFIPWRIPRDILRLQLDRRLFQGETFGVGTILLMPTTIRMRSQAPSCTSFKNVSETFSVLFSRYSILPLPAPHFLLLTPHFPLPIPHSPLHTSHSTLYTSHSTFHTPHSPQPTPNSIAQCCTCTISDNKSISIYRLKLIQQTSATSPRGINPTDCVVIPQSLYFNISKLIYCKELPQP